MSSKKDSLIPSVIRAYAEYFDEPTTTLRFPLKVGGLTEVAVIVRLPNEKEKKDPLANVTMIGTAGFAASKICQGMHAELAIDVRGSLSEFQVQAMAKALVELASVPLETGRPFTMNQIVTNLSLPAFPRFDRGMLLDWDPIDGFEFPDLDETVGLLRVLPLFETEATYVESSEDRSTAYLALSNWGLEDGVEADPEREAVPLH